MIGNVKGIAPLPACTAGNLKFYRLINFVYLVEAKSELLNLESDLLNNENELLLRLSQGDEQAFSILFHQYKDRIYNTAYKLTASPQLSEEAVQDVFLKIWIKRETMRDVKSFKDFLFIITRNHIFSTWKRLVKRQILLDDFALRLPNSENQTDITLSDKEFRRVLQQAIDQLPPQQKRVYQLSKEKGLKREEVAEILDISAETVKVHLAKSIRSIRAFCIFRLDLCITAILFLAVE